MNTESFLQERRMQGSCDFHLGNFEGVVGLVGGVVDP